MTNLASCFSEDSTMELKNKETAVRHRAWAVS